MTLFYSVKNSIHKLFFTLFLLLTLTIPPNQNVNASSTKLSTPLSMPIELLCDTIVDYEICETFNKINNYTSSIFSSYFSQENPQLIDGLTSDEKAKTPEVIYAISSAIKHLLPDLPEFNNTYLNSMTENKQKLTFNISDSSEQPYISNISNQISAQAYDQLKNNPHIYLNFFTLIATDSIKYLVFRSLIFKLAELEGDNKISRGETAALTAHLTALSKQLLWVQAYTYQQDIPLLFIKYTMTIYAALGYYERKRGCLHTEHTHHISSILATLIPILNIVLYTDLFAHQYYRGSLLEEVKTHIDSLTFKNRENNPTGHHLTTSVHIAAGAGLLINEMLAPLNAGGCCSSISRIAMTILGAGAISVATLNIYKPYEDSDLHEKDERMTHNFIVAIIATGAVSASIIVSLMFRDNGDLQATYSIGASLLVFICSSFSKEIVSFAPALLIYGPEAIAINAAYTLGGIALGFSLSSSLYKNSYNNLPLGLISAVSLSYMISLVYNFSENILNGKAFTESVELPTSGLYEILSFLNDNVYQFWSADDMTTE